MTNLPDRVRDGVVSQRVPGQVQRAVENEVVLVDGRALDQAHRAHDVYVEANDQLQRAETVRFSAPTVVDGDVLDDPGHPWGWPR